MVGARNYSMDVLLHLLLPLLLITSTSSSPAPSPSPSTLVDHLSSPQTMNTSASSPAPSPSTSVDHPSSPHIIYNNTTSGTGFKAKLIHRDLFGSPFHNPDLSEWDKTQLAIKRSLTYYSSLAVGGFRVSSSVREKEFIMYFDVGLPPQSTYAVVDTGSHLIWIQCSDCIRCLEQKPRLYHQNESTTYELIMYSDDRCRLLGDGEWNAGKCQYVANYADGTRSAGFLSEDTFLFTQWEPGADVSRSFMILQPIIFGCGRANTSPVKKPDGFPAGVVGLNNDKLSLLSQLGMSRFSLCVSKEKVTSINFGSFANMADKERISLVGFRLPNGEISYSDYFVKLLGISLSNDDMYTMLDIPGQFLEPALGGGALIDTGNRVTVVPQKVLHILMAKVQEDYFYLKTNYSADLPLCYDATYKDLKELSPTITLHFYGSELSLNLNQTWIPGNAANTSWCLAMMSVLDGELDYFIIGTHILANYNVGYDLENMELSLIPDYC